MKVGAVYADLPQNSTFAETALVLPWTISENGYRVNNTNWQDHNGQAYVQLQDGITAEQATEKIKTCLRRLSRPGKK